VTLSRGESVSLSTLVTYGDAEGDAPVEYYFWDANEEIGSGSYALDGVEQTARGWGFKVAASDLGRVTVVGGSQPGLDLLYVQVDDGTAWSGWDIFNLTTVNQLPVLGDSAAGGDTIIGTSDDLFVFGRFQGNDRLSDFKAGVGSNDAIDLFAYAFVENEDLNTRTPATDAGSVIPFEASNSLTLLGVPVGVLQEDDLLL